MNVYSINTQYNTINIFVQSPSSMRYKYHEKKIKWNFYIPQIFNISFISNFIEALKKI